MSALALVVSSLLSAATPQQPGREALPGPQADGTTLLPNGWRLAPHGVQTPLSSDLPVRSAWHPGGRWLAIQHAGYRQHQLSLFDARTGTVAATVPLRRTWSGLAWSTDGGTLFASGGVDDVLRVFSFDAETGDFGAKGTLPVGDATRLDLPAGMCVFPSGDLLVALQRSHAVARLRPDGTEVWRAALPDGAFPFECALHPDGQTLFVSLWGKAAVAVLAAADGAVRATIAAGQHPSEMLLSHDGSRLFVSNGNENTVSVIDTATARVAETLCTALHPIAPPGSTPNALALSPDGETLVVANADNNNCALFDVDEPGRSRSLGFIPVGFYPTSVRFSADGKTLVVANGKGSVGSRANPNGPTPGKAGAGPDDYTGAMFVGSVSMFALPDAAELAQLTARAYACCPLRPAGEPRTDGRPEASPIPARPGDPSPIRHVVYIVKENRTYDQVFGDLPQGNGDASLCLFPREVTPNHHAIAEQFVLLDNFYVESEVSADGHEWTMAGYASDFVERTWPVTYGGKGTQPKAPDQHVPVDDEQADRYRLGYPAEGNYEIAAPKSGYLWDLAKAANVSYHSFGEFVQNAARAGDPGKARIPVLEGHFDPLYRSFDMDYPDRERAARFLAELQRFEQLGELPRLIVLRLPNDHTIGTSPGKPTPQSCVADNDQGLGMVLQGLSKSRFWPTMAVFVVEDDAQNGPDHVDAHRSVGLVAGPFVRRGAVVSTQYSTCSMLRTMELILGLPPMTQFDAAARPMWDVFQADADPRGYELLPPQVSLTDVNAKTSWGAERSLRMDLSVEDAADDLLLNEIVWKSVRGADSPMPAPRRAAFVRAFGDDD